jgi:hypothetical protein
MNLEDKQCRECLLILPPEKFNRNSSYKDGRDTVCRWCFNEKTREKYDPVKKKSQHLKYLYGITLEDYEKRLYEQGGGCAICGIKVPGGNGKHFYVDHNHITNEVRGLLCHHCNLLIGCAKEDTEILRLAALYIDRWNRPLPHL